MVNEDEEEIKENNGPILDWSRIDISSNEKSRKENERRNRTEQGNKQMKISDFENGYSPLNVKSTSN